MSQFELNENPASNFEWLFEQMKQLDRPNFFCNSCLNVAEIGLEIAGIGPIELPLTEATKQKLRQKCRIAPYGKGTETIVDTNVRNTLELDPHEVTLSAEFNQAIKDALRKIAKELGLPADQLHAELYKLLVYEEGGFFLPHRDTEKQDRMVASMIVVLPNEFEGGDLRVQHGTRSRLTRFSDAKHCGVPEYAAFYADCEHEVERVDAGARLTLAYNLMLKPSELNNNLTENSPIIDRLAAAIHERINRRSTKCLFFALEHEYTQKGLSLDLLKGVDRQLAELVVPAALKAGCDVYLGQLSRHVSQDGDPAEVDPETPPEVLEQLRQKVRDVFTDRLEASYWNDLDGNAQWFSTIKLHHADMISTVPIKQWKPNKEKFMGFMGNSGTTIFRWYNRSILALWERGHHYQLIAECDANASTSAFSSSLGRLERAPEEMKESCRREAVKIARSVITHWPQRSDNYAFFEYIEDDIFKYVIKDATDLCNQEIIKLLLNRLIELKVNLSIKALVLKACHEFGWKAFRNELIDLINDGWSLESWLRDSEWLTAICIDPSAEPDRLNLVHELCEIVENDFRKRDVFDFSYFPENDQETRKKCLVKLFQFLAAAGRDQKVEKLIGFIRKSKKRYSVNECLKPALLELVAWSKEQFGKPYPVFENWLEKLSV